MGCTIELAALVDTGRLHGVEAIAQVDLGLRSHHQQPLLDLGAMATQILAAMLAREPGIEAPPGSLGAEVALRQFRPGDGGAEPLERGVPTLERPPARNV